MESKSRGIIIRSIKYGETSAICNILTEQNGLLGFHVQGAYTSKSKIRISYLQPLNTVELIYTFSKTKSLQRISDIHCHTYPTLTNFTQQAFYHILCELLQQSIKENELNPKLFEYLYSEAIPSINGDIHYWQLPFVMLNILHHYGCSPNCESYTDDSYLDLQNGVFLETLLPLKTIADKETSFLIHQMLTRGIKHLDHNAIGRQKVMDDLIRYYKWHVSEHFELKSREVLEGMVR